MSWLTDVWNILFARETSYLWVKNLIYIYIFVCPDSRMYETSYLCVKDLIHVWKIFLMSERSYLCVKHLIYVWNVLFMRERSYLCVKDLIYAWKILFIYTFYTQKFSRSRSKDSAKTQKDSFMCEMTHKIIGLFCKRALSKGRYSAKDSFTCGISHECTHYIYTAISRIHKQGQHQDAKRLIYVWNHS